MRMDGLNVVGTGHHSAGAEDLIYFDVLEDSVLNITKQVKEKEKIALYCIAQANLEKCQKEYELARQINVISTQYVIPKLIQEGFHVIWFSSDHVFDGKKGNYTELDRTNAISKYGKMKEEVEQYLLKYYPEVCIFRMPRVVGIKREKQNLLTDLENKLAENQVKCIKDNKLSLIAKEDIYQLCLIASERKMKGIYNLSNGEIYSRKELAEKFFAAKGIMDIEIMELNLEEFGFKDTRPLNVGLNNFKLKEETGYEFMTYEEMIKKYLTNNMCLNIQNGKG